jgi:hypothetical protein
VSIQAPGNVHVVIGASNKPRVLVGEKYAWYRLADARGCRVVGSR